MTTSTVDAEIERPRYTASGSDAAEERVRSDMAAVVPILRKALPEARAVFLVGGFGRGEGGMLEAHGPVPFNDYDLLVVCDRLRPLARAGMRRRLRDLAPLLEHAAGIPVDVAVHTRREVREAPPTLLWYEIAAGHRRLWGADDVVFARVDAAQLSADEAVLLLTNRASALLLRRFASSPGEAAPTRLDVVDAMKLVLAWGDALLLRAGRYTCAYAPRARALTDVAPSGEPFPGELRTLYERALAFKLHPSTAEIEAAKSAGWVPRVRQLHTAFLAWFESTRLGVPVLSWADYAEPRLRKLTAPAQPARMLLKHTVTLGPPRDLANLALHARRTHERLISTLPLLLFSDAPAHWDLAARLLNSSSGQGAERWRRPAGRYLSLWK